MKKVIFVIGLAVTLASCASDSASTEATGTDTLAVSTTDSTVGTQVDTVKIDSVVEK